MGNSATFSPKAAGWSFPTSPVSLLFVSSPLTYHQVSPQLLVFPRDKNGQYDQGDHKFDKLAVHRESTDLLL